MDITFDDLGLSKEILKSIEDMGFEEPSPIQALTIPPVLAGRDIVGQAQTGTGKTAAYGIPILERVDPRAKGVQALVLCPTRELAIQVAEELVKLASRKRGIAVLPIYGGQPIERQFRALSKGAQVVVGTPGRVMDHMKRGTLKLETVSMAVLDEADEMLDMGFREDIEFILDQCPDTCQCVFFSATMPKAIMDMARKFLDDPEILKISQKMLTVPSIEQVYYELRPHQKMEALCRVLDSQGFRKALVFCSTKRAVEEISTHLQTRGYQADALHGNLAQTQRDRVMNRFRTGGIEILVATDVAARGIDVDDVDAVINYDIPNDVENYVHRIGRTGRAGRSGNAYTFVTGRDHYRLRDIIRYTKARIVQGTLPTLRDVATIRTTQLMEEVRATMESGTLERHTLLVEQFLDDDTTSMSVAAALLKLLMQRDFGASEGLEEKEDILAQKSWQARPGESAKREKRDAARTLEPKQRISRARLVFDVGSNNKVSPNDFVGAIAGETGISGREIGAIEIHDKVTFVDVPAALADDIIGIMNSCFICGHKVTVFKEETKRNSASRYNSRKKGFAPKRKA